LVERELARAMIEFQPKQALAIGCRSAHRGYPGSGVEARLMIR